MRPVIFDYGDTKFRGKIAKTTTQMPGRKDIEVVPGESRPISGRQVHWAGHEGEGIPDLDAIEIKHLAGAVFAIFPRLLVPTKPKSKLHFRKPTESQKSRSRFR